MLRRATTDRLITQQNLRILIASAIFIAVVGFFVFEFRSLRAPLLVVEAPDADAATTEQVIDVRGRTTPDADVTVNGRPLYIGSSGEFEERFSLFPGVNTLTFEAKNRYGKTTRIVRRIVVSFTP